MGGSTSSVADTGTMPVPASGPGGADCSPGASPGANMLARLIGTVWHPAAAEPSNSRAAILARSHPRFVNGMVPKSSVRSPRRRGLVEVPGRSGSSHDAGASCSPSPPGRGGPTWSLPSALSERPPTPYQPRLALSPVLSDFPPSPLARPDQLAPLDAAHPARPARLDLGARP